LEPFFDAFAGLWVVIDVSGVEILGYIEAVGGETEGDDALGTGTIEAGTGTSGLGIGIAGRVGTDGAVLTIFDRIDKCGTATSFDVAASADFDIFTLVFSGTDFIRSLAAGFGFALAKRLLATSAQDAMTWTLLAPLSLPRGVVD
jgi:hypothetical protein